MHRRGRESRSSRRSGMVSSRCLLRRRMQIVRVEGADALQRCQVRHDEMAPVQFYQPLTTHFLQYPVGVHHRQSRCVRQFKLRDGKVEAAAADEAYRQPPVIEFAEEVAEQIGRASCRERVCKYVEISVVAVSLKKKK